MRRTLGDDEGTRALREESPGVAKVSGIPL